MTPGSPVVKDAGVPAVSARWRAVVGRLGRLGHFAAITRPARPVRLDRDWRQAVLPAGRALWPCGCLLCEQPIDIEQPAAALCGPCQRALPGAGRPRCPVCAAPRRPGADCADCARLGPAFTQAFAAADYRSPLADALLALKFGGRVELASACGRLLATGLSGQPGILEGVQALVPVPLASTRLIERGFNQAALIADALHRHWPLQNPRPAVRARWLARPRETRRQTGLGGSDRRHNLEHGFLAADDVAGLRVAVIDDVMTTGATLDAAARALRSAGAREVVALVVARTP